MKKLDLKHEPRQRRILFLDWIGQLEIAFSGNEYTRNILKDYSTNKKIHRPKEPLTDLLIDTVSYTFLGAYTRSSTIACTNKEN